MSPVETRMIGGVEFWLVGAPQLRRTAIGQLKEYVHELPEGTRGNAHAAGPFCEFGLPAAPRAPGAYAISVGGMIRYIGECEDLANRFGPRGYGLISPRNCHHDGQSTNCKLNSYVLKAVKSGELVQVWFHTTDDHKKLEQQLLAQLSPDWNGRVERRSGDDVSREIASRPHQPVYRDSPITGDFQTVLREWLEAAAEKGEDALLVNAGDLHRACGGYPGPRHRMPVCCRVMRAEMQPGDEIIQQPPKGDGASVVIRYLLPRKG